MNASPLWVSTFAAGMILSAGSASAGESVDFNRDIRPILASQCLLCHGPDEEVRMAGLRLDERDSSISELDSGTVAIVPWDPDNSELIARITSDDDDLRMPPADFDKQLTDNQIEVLHRWIEQGAQYAQHWSYVAPIRRDVPAVPDEFAGWPNGPIDNFILNRMLDRNLRPAKAASRHALARRVFLDLTGLPPSVEEADAFAASEDPQAWEKLVDDLLQRDAFGEHWARKWLDLARYADSAGYADDPPRTIWAYRDWVVRAINSNMPFDQFTIEQMAGDLLPDATESQKIATAFHRNTLTNSEGGTIDEEFRNAAVVDRVNTTMFVWMGTTMACAQCHTHKYDPITQDEYFKVFAILNNTEDNDRRDEFPVLKIYSDEFRSRSNELDEQIASLEKVLGTNTSELTASQVAWEEGIKTLPVWTPGGPSGITRTSGEAATIKDNGTIRVTKPVKQDTYIVDIPLNPESAGTVAAVRIEAIPDESVSNGGSGLAYGNFVITGIKARLVPDQEKPTGAQYVRITNMGAGRILSLAEVEVISGGENIATRGRATQISTDYNGPAALAIDGNTDGDFDQKSTTHTGTETDPWWEVDLTGEHIIDSVRVWNRTDNETHVRLKDFRVELLDADRAPVWQQTTVESPNPSKDYTPDNTLEIRFVAAFADYHQSGFEPEDVLKGNRGLTDGWAIGGQLTTPHQLVVVLANPVMIREPSKLRLKIEQNSPHANHLLGNFRLSVTQDGSAVRRSLLPEDITRILDQTSAERSAGDAAKLATYYRYKIAPELDTERLQLTKSKSERDSLTPITTVPVLRELKDDRRETLLQFRGSWLATGHKIAEGVPAVFRTTAEDPPADRLALAEWLMSEANPLTARVLVNRYWEALFGRGLVVTSEDFGTQGELPTHPDLLDWLATEAIRIGWDRKSLLKQIVMSAAYRQDARVTPDNAAADPGNRWLARGPRVRLSAEMVRDQALFVSRLLSPKMYGPPVRPPQPNLELNAAFGSSVDWKTSDGEDRYRRGLYTMWRRSNPYPSMVTFDAPNREVCTIRRNSTNTPLQSLVTLNDPVYVEAAQSLARTALQHAGSVKDQLTFAFRHCLIRPPTDSELAALAALYNDSREQLANDPEEAKSLATDPLGMLPDGMQVEDAAAMTVVGNVLLNLDEMFLKR